MDTKLIQGLNVKISLCNDKWLINCSYNPNKNMRGNHLRALHAKLYSSIYSNYIILEDFSVEMKEQQIRIFCDNYGSKNLVK